MAWRNALLTEFAPGASPEYVSAVRHGKQGLPPLPPFAAKYLDLVELSLTGSLLPESGRGECHPERSVKATPPRGKAGTCYAVPTCAAMVRTSGSRTRHPSSPPAAKRDDPPATKGGFASTTSKARPPARSATSRACRASHRRNRESPSRPRRSQPRTLTRQNASARRLVSTCVRGVVTSRRRRFGP